MSVRQDRRRPEVRMDEGADVWIGLDGAGVVVGLDAGKVVLRSDFEAEIAAAALAGSLVPWGEIVAFVSGLEFASEQGYITSAEALRRVAEACSRTEGSRLSFALTCDDPAALLVLARSMAVPDTLGQNPHTPLVGLVELASRARHEQLVAIRSGRLPGRVLARLAGSADSHPDVRHEALADAAGWYSGQRSAEDASGFLTTLAAETGWWERSELERSAMVRPVARMLYEVRYWGTSEASALAAGALARVFRDPAMAAPLRTTGLRASTGRAIENVVPGMARVRRWWTMRRTMRRCDRVIANRGRS